MPVSRGRDKLQQPGSQYSPGALGRRLGPLREDPRAGAPEGHWQLSVQWQTVADGRRCTRPGASSGWGAQTDSTGPHLSAPTYLFGETGIINSKGLAQIILQQHFQVRNSNSSPSRENSRGSRTRGRWAPVQGGNREHGRDHRPEA